MTLIKIDEIEVEAIRKRVKNLNIRVLPPEGKVVASIPLRMSFEAVSDFIRLKSKWIERQQKRIRERIYETEKDYTTGEEHFLFGEGYKITIVTTTGKEGVVLEDDIIHIYIGENISRDRKESLMERWYRRNLEENLPILISKWEKIIGVSVCEFRIRKMTSRWGTCNPRARRIWFSLLLAKRRPELVEYIVVHELIHLLEPSHNQRFYRMMDRFLPEWKELRKELR